MLLVDQILSIPSGSDVGSPSVCQMIEITGDDFMEENETFTVMFSVVDPLDVLDGANTVTVTIVDDGDGM